MWEVCLWRDGGGTGFTHFFLEIFENIKNKQLRIIYNFYTDYIGISKEFYSA